MAGYAAWILALTAAYAVFPGLRAAAWALIGASAVTAIVAGVARHRPARGEPWLLLAGACACLAASQAGFLITRGVPRAGVPFPWLVDGVCLAACPLAVAALAIFLRWRAAGQAGQAVLDAVALAAGCGFAWWLWLVFTRGTGAVTVNRAFAAAFPLGDVLILAMAARLLAARPAPARPAWLLAAGAAGLGLSDLAYALGPLHSGPAAALPVPLGWVLCFGAWGAAALDPAMTALTVPVPGRPAATPAARLALLAIAALAVPGALVALAARYRAADTAVVALGAGVFGLLVLGCLAQVTLSGRRALGRERALRLAAESFAAAAGWEDIAAAAQAAVGTLAGRYPLQALLAVRARRHAAAGPPGGRWRGPGRRGCGRPGAGRAARRGDERLAGLAGAAAPGADAGRPR